jgi:hypothetical protein
LRSLSVSAEAATEASDLIILERGAILDVVFGSEKGS